MNLHPVIFIADYIPYLLAILGLLIIWQIHDMQVRAGRIQAVDLWNRSGIRMFIQVTPNDPNACPVCLEANGKVFLPAVVAQKTFTPLHAPCTNPSGCRCLRVGLYGGWPEAQALLRQFKANPDSKTVRLSDTEMATLLGEPWKKSLGGSVDRISMYMLKAMHAEGSAPETAIAQYRFVVDYAKSDRDLPFVVPAYLRLVDLLEQVGRPKEALEVIDRFAKAYDEKTTGRHFPTEAQRALVSLRRTGLVMALKPRRPKPVPFVLDVRGGADVR